MEKRRASSMQKIAESATHDLRTPLSVIMVNAAVLARAEPLDDARRIKAAKRIVANAGRMNRMIADLFDFTLAELGIATSYRMVDTDLGDLALKAVQDARAAHSGRNIAIERTGDLRGRWDPEKLLRALQTMLATALKFGNSAELLRMSCAPAADPPAVEVSVEVASNPAFGDHLQHLFDSIRSGGEFEKDAQWIPLAILQQIVHAHQGTLWITSSVSDGVRLFVGLPKQVQPALPPAT